MVTFCRKQHAWRFRIAGSRDTRNRGDPRSPISHPDNNIETLHEKQAYIRTVINRDVAREMGKRRGIRQGHRETDKE